MQRRMASLLRELSARPAAVGFPVLGAVLRALDLNRPGTGRWPIFNARLCCLVLCSLLSLSAGTRNIPETHPARVEAGVARLVGSPSVFYSLSDPWVHSSCSGTRGSFGLPLDGLYSHPRPGWCAKASGI